MSSSSDNEVLVAMLTTDALEGKGEQPLINGHFERQLRDRWSSEELSWLECHTELMKLRDDGYTAEDICALLKVECNFDIERLLTKASHAIRFPKDRGADEWAFLKAASQMISNSRAGAILVRPTRSLLQNCKDIIAQSNARKSPYVIGLNLVWAANSDIPKALSTTTLDMPTASDGLTRQLDALCADLKEKLGVSDFVLDRSSIDPWVLPEETGSDLMEEAREEACPPPGVGMQGKTAVPLANLAEHCTASFDPTVTQERATLTQSPVLATVSPINATIDQVQAPVVATATGHSSME